MRSTLARCIPILALLATTSTSCGKKAQEAAPAAPPVADVAAAPVAEPSGVEPATTGDETPATTPTPTANEPADAGGNSTITLGGPAGDDEARQARTWLDAGIALAKEHQCEQAIADGFDKTIAFLEERHDPTKTKLRCGRTSVAGLGAGLEAALGGGDITVLGPELCDALFYKAYCLTELDRVPEAEAVLVRACELMPGDPMYLAELGDAQQRQGKSEAALATFEQALAAATALAAEPDAAERSPGGRTPVQWQTRALRGLGYALVELGRLEDARATYRRALDLDPNDEAAKKELAFVNEKLGPGAP
ncbi:MAG: tetratricopeptide repeat protein [Deltaproteobacteria bacterium]|nr:tetratricopeptide repeat protein [Deltaproteobacteria bacterium]